MRDLTQPPPAIKLTQQKQEAKFFCSKCGEDRGCDCNAPALERLAGIREYERLKKRRQREKANENNNRVPGTAGDVTLDEIMPTEAEEVTTQPRENPMTPESEVIAKLSLQIIDAGYKAIVAQLSAPEAIKRLERARDWASDNLRSIGDGFIPM